MLEGLGFLALLGYIVGFIKSRHRWWVVGYVAGFLGLYGLAYLILYAWYLTAQAIP